MAGTSETERAAWKIEYAALTSAEKEAQRASDALSAALAELDVSERSRSYLTCLATNLAGTTYLVGRAYGKLAQRLGAE